jgi:L-fucose mutarotase
VLKGIDPLLSGELLRVLDQMGHGDRLLVVDRNYPAYSHGVPVIRVDSDVLSAITAVLSVFPLDTFIDRPIERMGPQDDAAAVNTAQQAVLEAARAADPRRLEFGVLPRMDFYAAGATAYAVVQTRETAPYCDFILTKGVV